MSVLTWPLHARNRLQTRCAIIVILAMVAFAGADAIATWVTRQQAIAAAQAETANLSRSLADDVAGIFQNFDTILIGLRERVRVDGTRKPALDRLRLFLRERAAALPMLHSVLILDSAGRLLVSADRVLPPGMDMSNSATFRHHRDSADPGLYTSPPIRNILDGRWVIKISRRVNNVDGSFAGVVITCVTAEYFEALFRRFDVGRHGIILLARREGIDIARVPAAPDFIGKDQSQTPVFKDLIRNKQQGSYEVVSSIDGTRRVGSFYQVPDTPIMVFVGRSKSEVLAGWRTIAIAAAFAVWCMQALIYEFGRRLSLGIGDTERSRRALQRTVARIERSERHLTTANEHLALAQQIAQVGHWSVNLADNNVVTWSDEVYLIHGRERENFVPDLKNGIAAYHADDRAEVAAAISDTIETGRPFHLELRVVRPDRTIRVVKLRGVRQLDGANRPQTVFGVFIDITEQKQAEEALQQAHAEAEAANTALATANTALETMALQDALTKLANRRHFDAALEEEARKARRSLRPLALILIDVDHFKQFNDLYGHPAGDACLRGIAKTLQGFAHRAGDMACRYGGEEMALLLPDCREDQAIEIGTRVSQAIRDLAIEHAGSARGIVTVSAGVAVFGLLHAAVLPAELIEMADQALYAAKRGGRDRVLGHGDLYPAIPVYLEPETI